MQFSFPFPFPQTPGLLVHIIITSFKSSSLPSSLFSIEPNQLSPRILHILLRLHPHIKDRTILTTANNLTMHTPLTSLALRPQPPKPDFQIRDLTQRLLVQLPNSRRTVRADCPTNFVLAY